MRTMKDSSPKRQWPEEETAVRIVAVDIPFDQLARLFLKAILAMLVAVISLALILWLPATFVWVIVSSRLRKKGKALRRSGWSLNSFGGIRHIVVSVAPFIRQAQLGDVYRWAVSDPE